MKFRFLMYVYLVLMGFFTLSDSPETVERAETAEEVSPIEDLMREHGLLNRVLLIYEEVIRRLKHNVPLRAQVIADAASIIKNFIEKYHEHLEEKYIFPRFKRAGKLVELVDTLIEQHNAGRRLTRKIIHLANNRTLKYTRNRRKLVDYLRLFISMYRPHEAREDTVLFPAFRSLVTLQEYKKLGDIFEDKEHELFGPRGFESMVDKVAALEKELGIYAIAHFTPQVK